MTRYFKATRPDGTDFFSGTIHYAKALETGEVIRHPAVRMDRGNAGTYLSISVEPAETLIGGSWPCRLFEVKPTEGAAAAFPVADYPHKRAVRALRVVRELPAHEALGPNGASVAELIEAARALTGAQIEQLAAARDAARDAAKDAAWYAAKDAARDAAKDAAWYAARYAWYAAGDAAWALVVRDLISPEGYDLLTGPWRRAVGAIHPDDAEMHR